MQIVQDTVSSLHVADSSKLDWSLDPDGYRFVDDLSNEWILSDHRDGDNICLDINCHRIVTFSNIVIDPTIDYATLVAEVMEKVISS